MMKLPLLISVPHAGTKIPAEIEDLNLLTFDQIVRDGDDGAREIYDFADQVSVFITTDIARAYLDMNRSESDRRSDGVVKTETIYKEKIYNRQLKDEEINQLLNNYYHPYHDKLSKQTENLILGIDCHTMAAVSPPIAADAGTVRPFICLSNADGTCSDEWITLMANCLEKQFGFSVSINIPFQGGYIIRSHAKERPWLQLELSRAEFLSVDKKRENIIGAFRDFCSRIKK